MELTEAKRMIAGGVDDSPGPKCWADLGAGAGLFTHALASLLPADSIIHAVDKDARSIRNIPGTINSVLIERHGTDFSEGELPFPVADGLLLANAIHFVKDKELLLERLKENLKPNGVVIIVEYELNAGNAWVPFP